MAKDPAVLWYWNDWQGGTSTFTRHLKGCYMDLLNAQFNNGRLSLAEIKTVLGTDFGSSWPTLQKKFEKDEDGLFFNARMESEKLRRGNFIERQKENGSKGGRPKNPRDNPRVTSGLSNKENENRNETETGIEIKGDSVKGENWDNVKMNFFNSYQWKEKFCRDKKIEMADLEKKMESFISDIELKEDYKPLTELKRHFINLTNKNGTHQQFSGSKKPGTSDARTEALRKW